MLLWAGCMIVFLTNAGLVFAEMLNEMRLGRISDETVRTFRSMARPLPAEGGIEVTELWV